MIIWINGAFGAGKTQTAFELNRRIPNSFVFDPENIGYFINKNIPQTSKNNDFQDYELWRIFNYLLIEYIDNTYDGVLIIPMTITNPEYFNDIVGYLRNKGISINHFTLLASKETVIKRLKSRGDGKDSWAVQQIDRCISSFQNNIFKQYIDTENMQIEDVAEKIALESNISLITDKRSKLSKKLRRIIIKIKHIRLFSWRI